MMKSPHASNKVYGSLPRMAGFKNRGYKGVDPDEDYIETLYEEPDEFDKEEKEKDDETYTSEESEQDRLTAMFGQNWEYRL